MTRLTAELPRSISIGGAEYAINTDYRIMADFETKINNADISDRNAFARIFQETISALFIDAPRADIRDIVDGILWYYRCGKEPVKKSSSGGSSKRYYDYDEDADYIFAAFMQIYGDDLVSSHMHWWAFRAKFMGLTDETEFVKIMQYRGTNVSKIKNKEEKARIKKLQERFALNSQKMQKFESLESRNEAFKRKLQERYAEVKRQAENAGKE